MPPGLKPRQLNGEEKESKTCVGCSEQPTQCFEFMDFQVCFCSNESCQQEALNTMLKNMEGH